MMIHSSIMVRNPKKWILKKRKENPRPYKNQYQKNNRKNLKRKLYKKNRLYKVIKMQNTSKMLLTCLNLNQSFRIKSLIHNFIWKIQNRKKSMKNSFKNFIINWVVKFIDNRNLHKMVSDGNILCVKFNKLVKILLRNVNKDTN